MVKGNNFYDVRFWSSKGRLMHVLAVKVISHYGDEVMKVFECK